MPTGAITGSIDVAQVVLYAFWIFFFGLIIYLRREDRREGYPLLSDDGKPEAPSFIGVPPSKAFKLEDGRTFYAPRKDDGDRRPIRAVATAPWAGSPVEPVGNPMIDGVGPGSYAMRADVPENNFEGHPKIVPLRVANEYYLEERDPDPRGMTVVGADGVAAGRVREVWIDRSEFLVRYLEVELDGDDKPGLLLVPMTLAKINGNRKMVFVDSILASQFADAPRTKSRDQVTLYEEDRITGYFGGGILYAEPSRKEPLI
jgi:photosynthetic reaction center H subunit